MKRVLLVLLGVVLLLVAVLVLNTYRQRSHQLDVAPAPKPAIDAEEVAESLAGAIRLRTISSRDDPSQNAGEFLQLHAWLAQRFPKLHATLQRELMPDGRTLLFTWPGNDANAGPIALMAHQDVVPIATGSARQWQVEPFSGLVRDGFVWGRGAWDDKGNLIAQLQAVELLLEAGFTPKSTVYLAFGADEEVLGGGAQEIVKRLQERDVRLDFVLDEGLLITQGVTPGIERPVALLGVAEKGFLSVQLEVRATPGHSSMPPPPGSGAISLMNRALQQLEERQFPSRLRGVAREMFAVLTPEMSGLQRVVLSNLWLFGPLVEAVLTNQASTNAMLRTTTALTMINAGIKDNVLPGEAKATVNFRLLPGETRDTVLRHVREVVGEQIKISALPGSSEPSPVSSTQSPGYRLIAQTIRSLFPDTLVAPGLMVGATDSRSFAPITDHIYRFSPMRARPEDLPRFHGTNERIAISNLVELVQFYHQLIKDLDKR